MPKLTIKLLVLVLFIGLLFFRLYYAFTYLPQYKDSQKIAFTSTLSEEPEINTGRQ